MNIDTFSCFRPHPFCYVYHKEKTSYTYFFNSCNREQSSDISETGVSENDENPVRIISVTPAKTETVKNKVNFMFL